MPGVTKDIIIATDLQLDITVRRSVEEPRSTTRLLREFDEFFLEVREPDSLVLEDKRLENQALVAKNELGVKQYTHRTGNLI